MSDKDSKYPSYKMRGPHGQSKAGYEGSGALHDRVESFKDTRIGILPARGEEKMHIHNTNRAHFKNPDHKLDSSNEFAPGKQSSTPMKMGKIHGYRAHSSHEGAHGVTKHDNDTALRYSGNDAAHRIGDKSSGKFKKIEVRLAGLCNVNGEKEVGMVKGKEDHTAHVQSGNKKQPKGHKSAVAKMPEAKKSGKSAERNGHFNRK